MAITVKKKSVTANTISTGTAPLLDDASAQADENSGPDNVLPLAVMGGEQAAGTGGGNTWASLLAAVAVICIAVLVYLQWSELKYLENAFPATGAVTAVNE